MALFLLARNHGWQLEQIANKHHLHSPKWHWVLPIEPKRAVNRIKQVGPHHADFVNHQHLNSLEPFFIEMFGDVFGLSTLALV